MKCSTCDKKLELDEEEKGVCSTCLEAMKFLHPKSKKLNARLKCHKENAKKLKQKQ